MGTDGVDFLQGLDVPHLYEAQSSEKLIPFKEQKLMLEGVKVLKLLTMMVQSADPLYSLFL